MLVQTIYILIFGGVWPPQWFIVNVIVHMLVDNLKANEKEINLIQDQCVHILKCISRVTRRRKREWRQVFLSVRERHGHDSKLRSKSCRYMPIY